MEERSSTHRHRFIFFSTLLTVVMLLVVFQVLLAQEVDSAPPNLTASEKKVNFTSAEPDTVLNYQVVIDNGTDIPALDVEMIDSLPSELAFVTDTLEVVGGIGLYGEDGNTITWTGSIAANQQVIVSFSASLDEALVPGDVVTNTAHITAPGVSLSRFITTKIITDSPKVYLPVASRPFNAPVLSLQSGPTLLNEWTLSWTTIDDPTNITGFEVQVATDASFNNVSSIAIDGVGNMTLDEQYPPSPNNTYYYRVRSIGGGFAGGLWSNVIMVAGHYRDHFDDPGSDWRMRREDTDSVDNSTWYESGHLILRMKSRWDYLIVSPLKATLELPYRIETKVRLEGQDNEHSYGIVFGGDWDDTSCPNSDYSRCFNHYYRLIVVWFTPNSVMKYLLKRIEYHDPSNNHGRGTELIPFTDVQVNSPSIGYQTWAVELFPNGDIKIFVNGNLVGVVNDTAFINDPYFAVFTSTDEYTGLQAEFDYFDVMHLE
jgi:uncharacterized repeat protein (TIGR01451 family)